MATEVKTFSDNPAVAHAFANDFVDLLNKTLDTQSRVTVALSGGSTPKLLFEILATDYKTAVDWNKIHFFWVDERCVPPHESESNFGEADRLFLSQISINPANIHRVRGESNPLHECDRYEDEIKTNVVIVDDTPVFDIMLLGMGGDGHTASIFPAEIEFLKSSRICEVATHPESGQKRITVTGRVVNASSNVFFLITGGGKAEVLAEIMNQTGNYLAYPASFVTPESGVVFYLDEFAAEQL